MYKYLLPVALCLLVVFSACQANDGNEKDNNAKESEDKDTKTEKMDKSETKEPSINGTLWEADGDGGLGVVFSHGAAYDANSWKEQGERLAESGITAFAVEDTTANKIEKAGQMLLKNQGVDKVALIGASAGGKAAIEAASEDESDFDKVVLLSPTGDANDIEDVPVLVIYSEEEGFDDLEKNKADNVETIAIPGKAHAQEMFNDEEKGKKVMDEINDFLNQD